MFDAKLRPLIDPPLNAVGRQLAQIGVSANVVTLAGVIVGVAAGGATAAEHYALALVLIIANRLLDGLDGAVARATQMSDFGGYFDIVADFIFYAAVPMGFGLAAETNQLPALVLLASFILTGTSFLAFATIAAKRGLDSDAHGRKSFLYTTGLAEGTETVLVFIAMALFPHHFPAIAYGYAALCALTLVQRSWIAWLTFGRDT